MENILLDKAYVSSPCRLRSMDNSIISSGRIIEIDDEYVVIRMIPELRSVIPYNKSVKLSIFNDRLGNRALMGTVFASTTKIAKLFDVKEIDDFEKRVYFRINVSLNGTVMPYDSASQSKLGKVFEQEAIDEDGDEDKDNDIDKGIKDDKESKIDVYIRNISLSGVLLSGPIYMDIDDKLLIEIHTSMGKLTLGAVIRRKTESKDGDDEYGCEFEPYSDKVEDALWRYMMQKELESIRKAKGGWLISEDER